MTQMSVPREAIRRQPPAISPAASLAVEAHRPRRY